MDTDNPLESLAVLGVNHTCSKTDLRDRILFTKTNLTQGLENLRRKCILSESVILSTCNRVEIYGIGKEAGDVREHLLHFLCEFHGVNRSEVEPHTYFYTREKTVEHLLHVAASLDSLVVGEVQILGQVKEAFQTALETGNTKILLNQLFQTALSTGKRVRTETKIGEGAVSISFASVELAKKILGNLESHSALIIGAGEMSELTVKHLKQAGISKLLFANRTLEKSAALAEEFGGTAFSLDELDKILPLSDIVITATASPHYIIGKDQVEKAMEQRKNDPVFFIDIAAPRDIHPEVGSLYNVFLYTIDDLAKVAEVNAAAREKEIQSVKGIISEEMEKFKASREARKVQPVLVSLRREFETIKEQELQRYSSQLNSLPKPAQELVAAFARSLTNKFLHEPSKSLKEMAATPEKSAVLEAVQKLFNLKIES